MVQETKKKLDYLEVGNLTFKAGKLTSTQIARHRNGVCGAPFYVVHFTDSANPEEKFVGILFDEEAHCAVFNRDLVPTDIRFFFNSFRGDYFESDLREIAKRYEEATHENLFGEAKDDDTKNV